MFLACSLYAALSLSEVVFFLDRYIWNHCVHLKVSFFFWLLWWDRAPTLDNLPEDCLLQIVVPCVVQQMSLLATSLFTVRWQLLFGVILISQFNVKWVLLGSVKILLESWPYQSFLNLSSVGKDSGTFYCLLFVGVWEE